MKTLFAASLLFIAAAGAGSAQSNGIVAAGHPVGNAYGECWQAGPDSAVAAECAPAPVALARRAVDRTHVRFDVDCADLGDDAREALDDLARRLLRAELIGVIATAQADGVGGKHYDALLAARRAEAIRAYLVAHGIPESVVQLDER